MIQGGLLRTQRLNCIAMLPPHDTLVKTRKGMDSRLLKKFWENMWHLCIRLRPRFMWSTINQRFKRIGVRLMCIYLERLKNTQVTKIGGFVMVSRGNENEKLILACLINGMSAHIPVHGFAWLKTCITLVEHVCHTIDNYDRKNHDIKKMLFLCVHYHIIRKG